MTVRPVVVLPSGAFRRIGPTACVCLRCRNPDGLYEIVPAHMFFNAPEPSVTATAKVIAFANQKGGVAKTTTTLNLAVAFAEEGHRVLCVDMDPQGNLTMSQGIDPDGLTKSMYDVLVHTLLDPRGDPQARDRRRLRVDRPRRRGDRDVDDDRAASARCRRHSSRSSTTTTSCSSTPRRASGC